jgi:hypothetical protein
MSKRNRIMLFVLIIIILIVAMFFFTTSCLKQEVLEGNEILFVSKSGASIMLDSSESEIKIQAVSRKPFTVQNSREDFKAQEYKGHYALDQNLPAGNYVIKGSDQINVISYAKENFRITVGPTRITTFCTISFMIAILLTTLIFSIRYIYPD